MRVPVSKEGKLKEVNIIDVVWKKKRSCPRVNPLRGAPLAATSRQLPPLSALSNIPTRFNELITPAIVLNYHLALTPLDPPEIPGDLCQA